MHMDTIAAVSTPPGFGAIGIVRMSGPAALSIAQRIFKGKATNWESHRADYGAFCEPENQDVLDYGLLLFMKNPHSFTGEDLVEFHCHGGHYLVERVLSICLEAGARLATAGEFSQRAFLNGKLDLTQAEAIMDLIHSPSQQALHMAAHQLEGHLSEPIRAVRKAMIGVLAAIEANIDFPDEVDPPETDVIIAGLDEATQEIQRLLATSDAGKIWKQGIKMALVGEPNVGKSTLLNALLRYERAIVSNIAGTTRDTVEDDYNLRGIPVRIVDTAGLRDTADEIESIGIARTEQALNKADIVMFINDASQELSPVVAAHMQKLPTEKIILVHNKSDLLDTAQESPALPTGFPTPAIEVWISALAQQGIEDLENHLFKHFSAHQLQSQDISVNERHKVCLLRAQEALSRAKDTLNQALPFDFVSIDLKEAITAFGEIIGESVSEEVIHEVFHRFCVGK